MKYERPLFGCAGLYTLSHKGKVLIGANKRQEKIRIDQIPHDIAVLDSACYFIAKQGIPLEAITTERQLRSLDGFGTRNHKADFIFTKAGKIIAVEVELNPKTKDRFLKNIKQNYLNYDAQIWIVPKDKTKILKLLAEVKRSYDSVELLYLEEIYES